MADVSCYISRGRGVPEGKITVTDTERTLIHYQYLEETPVGRLLLAGSNEGLRFLCFEGRCDSPRRPLLSKRGQYDYKEVWRADSGHLDETVRQLKAYFSGDLTRFDLPLAPQGTDFQRKVWSALLSIPWGETATYGEVARMIGQPAASRAVGLANGRNPVSIIIPCHRVIGSNGKLVGYGGGLEQKRILLELEQSWPVHRQQPLPLLDTGPGASSDDPVTAKEFHG